MKENQEPQTEQQSVQPKKDEKDLLAILSYFGILFLIPLLAGKNNKFNQFHAMQGLVLFIAEMITIMFARVPIIGWIGAPMLYIVWFVLFIVGIANVLQGQKKELPLIGQFVKNFNI